MSLKKAQLELSDHWGIRSLAVMFVVLTVYAVGDFYLGAYAYAETPPIALLLASGVIALGLGLTLGRGALRSEKIPAAALFAAAVVAANYSLLLRVNALSASEGPQMVTYLYVGDSGFDTERAGYPKLVLTRFPQNWLEDRVNARHDFEMIHGALGFYQYNQARFQNEMREHLIPGVTDH